MIGFKNGFVGLGLVALAVALSACGEGNHTLDQTEMMTARTGALEFGGAYAEVVSVSPVDSAPIDGYVTVTMRNRSEDHKVFSVVCGYRQSAPGCKLK